MRREHNGDVWFISTASNQKALNFSNSRNVKITGFKIWIGGTDNGYGISCYGDSLITIDNCLVTGAGGGDPIELGACSNFTISNCEIGMQINTNPADQDPLQIYGGYGGFKILNNKLIHRNRTPNASRTAHYDLLQIGPNTGGYLGQLSVISGNLFLYHTEPSYETSINTCLYISYAGNNRWLICNNIFAGNAPEIIPVFFQQENPITDYKTQVFFFNNTVIKDGDDFGYGLFFADYPAPSENIWIDTLVCKNNIIVRYTPDNQIYVIGRTNSQLNNKFKDIDYNRYYKPHPPGVGFEVSPSGGTVYNWSQWKALNGGSYDQNSDTTGIVSFSNLWGEDFDDYTPNQGVDEGIELTSLYPDLVAAYPDLLKDALGNNRDSTPDLGAIESGGIPSSGINVKAKIFLQGPFNTNSMSTALNQNSMLPNSQPYNAQPWNYNGNESFNPGSNSSVVDWVLVELRNATSPSQIVESRAALLKSNGLLLETNGIEGVNFSNVQPGSLLYSYFSQESSGNYVSKSGFAFI